MEKFLLTVNEGVAGQEFLTRHLVEAESYQHVKYHYHRTLKDWGWHDTQFGKHVLEGPNGLHSEIQSIQPLDDVEYEVMKKYLTTWAKV